MDRPRSTLSQKELQDQEDYEFTHGPLRVLSQAVQNSNTVLISLRNNHKLVATVKAFDRHCNMILINVKEFWYDTNGSAKVLRERFVSKMFLRGDSVVVILKYQDEMKG
jgi:small nuclear ribonucleoprotein D2